MRKNTAADFWSKVRKGAPDECWEWQAGRTVQSGNRGPAGYGVFSYQNRRVGAHRWSWEYANGPIPEGMSVCHTCDNPPCVNPAHLFVGDAFANMGDAAAKGRMPSGERNDRAVLTEADVREIRALRRAGVPYKVLVARFGVTDGNIGHIVTGRSWRGV